MSKRWHWLAPSLRPNHLPKWRGRYVNAWFGIARCDGLWCLSLGPWVLTIKRGEIACGRAWKPAWLRLAWAAQ